jgi:hypothetical protein
MSEGDDRDCGNLNQLNAGLTTESSTVPVMADRIASRSGWGGFLLVEAQSSPLIVREAPVHAGTSHDR